MDDNTFDTQLIGKILMRIVGAIVGGLIMGGGALWIFLLPGYGEQLEALFPESGFYFSGVMIVFIVFEVVIQLLRGTVFQYGLGTARGLASMIVLTYTTNGGVISESIPFGPSMIGVTIEFKPLLAVFMTLSLLVVFKNVMSTVDFLNEMSEEPKIPEELP